MKVSNKIDYIDNKGKLDIYAFMRSDVIREYMKNNKAFSILEKARIICSSFYPVETKIDALKVLIKEAKGEDRKIIESSYKLMEKVISTIYNPKERVLYSVTMNNASCVGAYAMRENEYAPVDYYYSYKEFAQENMYNLDDATNEEECDYTNYFCVDVIPFENKGYANPYIITFKATYFDDKLMVYDFDFDEVWAELCGFNVSEIDLISGFNMFSIERYSLPFIHNEKVMIKTPFMRKALHGILSCSMDAFGCWYYFFYYDDESSENGIGCLDLSYHELYFGTGLSVFDWLYPSDFEPSEILKKIIENDNESSMSNEDISEIKDECYASVICRVKSVVLGNEREVDVVLEDDSGIVEGRLKLFEGDKKWILDIAKNMGKIRLNAKFVKKNDGSIYMEHANDCYILSRGKSS